MKAIIGSKTVLSFQFATEKDVERAEGLKWRGKSFGDSYVIPNAKKMAKLITDKRKILGRFEAVHKKWGPKVAAPFAARIGELYKGEELGKAWTEGLSYGETGMNPAPKLKYKHPLPGLCFI